MQRLDYSWTGGKSSYPNKNLTSRGCAYVMQKDIQVYYFKYGSPDAVKDVSILKYSKQFVVCCNLMEVCSLFICKEQVRLPNGVQHGRIQVQRVIWILFICQSWVIPLLPQKYIEPVILHYGIKLIIRNYTSYKLYKYKLYKWQQQKSCCCGIILVWHIISCIIQIHKHLTNLQQFANT